MRAQGYGAECEHGRLARKCERCADADEIASLRDCAKRYERWLAQDHATIADLRDRLRVLAPMVCEGCGCAVATHKLAAAPTRSGLPSCASVCYDCYNTEAAWEWWDCSSVDVMCACISVGLRALCGRRLLDGCDTTKGGE